MIWELFSRIVFIQFCNSILLSYISGGKITNKTAKVKEKREETLGWQTVFS